MQAANALPYVRAAVREYTAGSRAKDIRNQWLEILKSEGHSNPSARTIDKTIARLRGNPKLPPYVEQDSKYPEPETAWYWAHALRKTGVPWSWPPIIYLMFGHFPAFVECLGTCDLSLLSIRRLCAMLDALEPAVRKQPIDAASWVLTETQGRAFLRPSDAKRAFPTDSRHARFLIAHAIASDFSLSYDLQKFGVLEQVIGWAASQKANL